LLSTDSLALKKRTEKTYLYRLHDFLDIDLVRTLNRMDLESRPLLVLCVMGLRLKIKASPSRRGAPSKIFLSQIGPSERRKKPRSREPSTTEEAAAEAGHPPTSSHIRPRRHEDVVTPCERVRRQERARHFLPLPLLVIELEREWSGMEWSGVE
jgi:hypothetical protein